MNPDPLQTRRRRLALLAFASHGPGLWLVGHYKLGPTTLKVNAVAWGLTFIGMGVGYAHGGVGPLIGAWLVGHFAWGSSLAYAVSRGWAER